VSECTLTCTYRYCRSLTVYARFMRTSLRPRTREIVERSQRWHCVQQLFAGCHSSASTFVWSAYILTFLQKEKCTEKHMRTDKYIQIAMDITSICKMLNCKKSCLFCNNLFFLASAELSVKVSLRKTPASDTLAVALHG